MMNVFNNYDYPSINKKWKKKQEKAIEVYNEYRKGELFSVIRSAKRDRVIFDKNEEKTWVKYGNGIGSSCISFSKIKNNGGIKNYNREL